MPKEASISIRLDSGVKEKLEPILSQFGLNMSVVVNMMFHQIIREKEIPLSLSLKPHNCLEELAFARLERKSGFKGRTADEVAADMEGIISRIEKGT